MAERLLTPYKALRTLRKTSVLLRTVVAPISPTDAQTFRSAPDGWRVLDIVCHLRDYECVLLERVQVMLQQEHPLLPTTDNATLVARYQPADPDFQRVVAELAAYRQELLHVLESLSAEQWQRTGRHPTQGRGTLLEVAINAGLHDIDHIEELVRCVTASV
jgi:hypothetical protein